MQLKADSAHFALFQGIFLLLAGTLFIDAVNGFFLTGLGIDAKLSAVYKLALIGLILCQVGCLETKTLAWFLVLLLSFLLSAIYSLAKLQDVAGFFDEFVGALKILIPAIVFSYIVILTRRYPESVEIYGKYVLNFAFLVLISNLLLGLLGFGYSSYGSGNLDDEHAIGIKGFFYAGNEVSGVFIALYGFVLHQLWQNKKWVYFLFAPIALLSGLMIATKAAMLAGVVLVFAIPIVNERNRFLNITSLKLKLLVPLLVVFVVLAVVLVPIFESTGLLNRLIWFYEKKGIIGIILSGRDEFIISMSAQFEQHVDFVQIIIGLGKTSLGLISKPTIEVDPIDLYLWHGLFGVAYFLVISALFLRISYLAMRSPLSYWGPYVFIVNVMLIAVSFIAGHVFTSGMLGPFLGLINGLAYMDLIRDKNINAIK